MRQVAWRASLAAVAAAAMSMGSGCVAFNVGKPEVFTHTDTVVTTTGAPLRTEVLSVEAKAQADGNQLRAWLDADVREEFQRWKHDETVTVKKQKRLAVGLFPAGASVLLVPEHALSSPPQLMRKSSGPGPYSKQYVRYLNLQSYGRFLGGQEGYVLYLPDTDIIHPKRAYVFAHLIGSIAVGIPQIVGSIGTLLFEPLSCFGWEGAQEFMDSENIKHVYEHGLSFLDSSGSPKIRAVNKFSPRERIRMGVLTCYDVDFAQQDQERHALHKLGYFGLLGVYKYCLVVVDGPVRDGATWAGTETKRRSASVTGPYEVELHIPGTGISSKASVGVGNSKATFTLPQVERGGSYEATLEFRSLYTGTEDAVRKAWTTRTLKKTVWLQEEPKPTTVATQLVREVVKEIHHYHETRVVEERKPEGAPWDIETVEPFHGGRAVYRVTIRNASKKAVEVEREVRPDIERNLREAFLAAMPGMDEGRVRAYAVAEYEVRAIRFRGVAFSVQPLTDGWTYDEETRRGTVRLRISEGMTPDEAKRWARQNIEAIVNEKNVALEAGRRPPDGAVYRSLVETLEDGVLTVEFEAVE